MTICALVPDEKKADYVCLRYQPSKASPIVDLYFQVCDDENWCEAMHVMIEVSRKVKIEEMHAKAGGPAAIKAVKAKAKA